MQSDSYRRALEFYLPYIAAREPVATALNRSPLGIRIPKNAFFDPYKTRSGTFLDMVHRLHTIVCGPFGMAMPKWVAYDCALVPGVVFGFARPAEELQQRFYNGLEIPEDYSGLVPFSVGIAVPLADRVTWELYSMGSINQIAPGAGPAGLNRLTLAFGTAALRCKELIVTCPWRSFRMSILSGLGPLELITAWTPAHDNPMTATFKVATNDAARERLLRGGQDVIGRVDRHVDADDKDAMRALQREIEAGRRVSIVGQGQDWGTEVQFPLQMHRSGAAETEPEPRTQDTLEGIAAISEELQTEGEENA